MREPKAQLRTLDCVGGAFDSISSSANAGDAAPRVEEAGIGGRALNLPNDTADFADGRTRLSTVHEESDTIEDGSGSLVSQQRNRSHYRNTVSNGIPANETRFRRDFSVPGITEAYLVDDEVVFALPTKPWWKQRRTHFFALAVVAILAISLGIALSTESQAGAATFITTAFTPSPSTSAAPSSSQSPSFSPSSCAFTISSNAQNLGSVHPEASDPVVAIDGRNLVVASRVIPSGFFLDGGSVVVEFYSMSDEGAWERVNDFAEGGFDWEACRYDLSANGIYSSGVYISLSGGTTMVGIPCLESVTVYRQNSYGRWERLSDGSPQSVGICGFGMSATVDGTLMVTSDWTFCGYSMGPNSAYLFRIFRDKWMEVSDLSNQTFILNNEKGSSVREVSIRDNTVVVKMNHYPGEDYPCHLDVYRYEQNNQSITRLEDSLEDISCSDKMLLSDDHFVLARQNGVSIFKRQDPNLPFGSFQFINSSDYGEGFGRSLSLDEGILVVGSDNYTHVFSLQDSEKWEEVLVIAQSYDSYQISGRALIAANQTEAVAMNIANCMPPIPTAIPSVSSPPFTCYEVEFNFSNFVMEWDLDYGIEAMIRKIDGNSIVVETFPLDEDQWDETETADIIDDSFTYFDDHFQAFSYRKSMCLPHGSYEFILKLQSDGRTVDNHYTVKSYGQLITQGAVNSFTWGNLYTETIGFNVPFDGKTTQVRPTMLPTLPSAPSQTLLPTMNGNKLTPSLAPASPYIRSAAPTLSNPVMGTPHKTSWFPTFPLKTSSPTDSPLASFSEPSPSPISSSAIL